ncbi:MAG TPA: hypothetical protein VFZ23_15510 [Pyrinomonadaceae bacterium]
MIDPTSPTVDVATAAHLCTRIIPIAIIAVTIKKVKNSNSTSMKLLVLMPMRGMPRPNTTTRNASKTRMAAPKSLNISPFM